MLLCILIVVLFAIKLFYELKKQEDFNIKYLLLRFISIMTVVLIILLPKRYVNDSIYFSIIPILFYSFFGKINVQKNNFKYVLVLSFLFLMMLSISNILSAGIIKLNFENVSPVDLILKLYFIFIYFPILILSTISVVNYIFNLKIYIQRDKKIDKKIIAILGIIILIVSLIFLFYGFPYFNYPDITGLENQVKTGQYSEWHTFGFTLFVKYSYILFSKINNTPFCTNLLQTIFFVVIYIYSIISIYHYTKSKKATFMYLLIILLIFTPFIYISVGIKDFIFSLSLFAYVISIFNILNDNNSKIVNFLFLLFGGIGVSIFRHANYLAIIISLIILIVYYFKLKDKLNFKMLILTFILTILSIYYVNTYLVKKYNVLKNPEYIKYSVPAYLVASTTDKIGIENIDNYTKNIMEQYMPIDKWNELYNKNIYLADTVSREWYVGDSINKFNNDYGINLLKLNFYLLVKYPVYEFESLFDINSIIWEIGRPTNGYEWGPIYGQATDYESAVTTLKPTKIYKTLSPIINGLEKIFIIRSILFRGGIWLFLLILSFVKFLKCKEYKYLLLYIPIFIIQALLFISVPAQDPRYILPIIMSGLFVVYISFIKNKKYNKVSF